MKKTVRNILQFALVALMMGLLGWGIYWASGKEHSNVCQYVDVVIVNADSSTFVTRDGMLSELEKENIVVIGKEMSEINTGKIEEILQRSDYLETVECYKAQSPGGKSGKLVIKVKQLVPVMRVFDGARSYYVNRNGKRMEAISRYHADVPVVQGHFYGTFTPKKMMPLIEYVEKDSLLKALVGMYSFKDSTNVFVIPTISGHVVNMGDVSNYENKFNKLLLFYRKVMPVKGWQTYDTINLKWNYQVVASKRGKRVEEVIDYSEDDDEPDPDIEMLENDGTVVHPDSIKQKLKQNAENQ